jgi:signal transduction histidine kinase
MDKEERKASVTKHTKHIRSRIWMILLSALLPFLLLALAIVMQADTTNEKLLETALFLLAAGISFLATKLASYTIIDRYLSLIESLDDTKSDFISIASHQLKSPVSSLKYTMDVFTDALENEDWETVRDFSGDIDLSVKRLDSLTHRFLDVSRD